MKREVIIACDFPTREEALAFLGKFREEKPYVKIGMELFYGEGPEIVREIKARGHKVFLDLKLHDIPNTVERAMANLGRLGVDMTNLHAGGGIEMMKAAKKGLEAGSLGREKPLLIAVTMLTSISNEMMNSQLGIPGDVAGTVAQYAKNARQAGLDGVVCSPLEAGLVKQACGSAFLTVTPGIRYPSGDLGDQSRVTTPERARESSNFIVMGRPITAAADPVAAYRRASSEFTGEV